LLIRFDFLLAQNFVHFRDHRAINNFAQSDGIHVIDGDHDLHIGFKNPQHIELSLGPGNDVAPDGFDFAHAMGRIYDFFTNLKHSDLLAADRFRDDFRTAVDIELTTG
jgi:hypothetical protein